MNPDEFLSVANLMLANSGEAHFRTAIGRSYYAVFNMLRDSLEARGVLFTHDGSDHWRLVNYLQRCNHQDAARLGQIVQDLQAQRTRADYEMSTVIDKRQAELAYRKANLAVTRFCELCAGAIKTVVPVMRATPLRPLGQRR